MTNEGKKAHVGEQVILLGLPAGFLNGLPDEDQRAITAMIGRPVTLVGYDEEGRAELHFDDPFETRTDNCSHTHSIWVERECLSRITS